MAINLRDYSRTAAQRGWGAGWPSCGGAKAAGTAIVTADLSGTRMSVHKRIARLVDLLCDATERRGFRLKPGQCGGYNCRAISGTSSPSNHSWGLAVDINWNDNPYTTNPRLRTIPDWMVAQWNRYGFAWGGHYTGSMKDYMHFEFMGTPAQADQMTALALTELAPGASTTQPVTPVTPKELPTMIDRPLVKGTQTGRIICPTGTASGIVAAAWVSVTITGGGRVELWCQRGARSQAAPPGTANGTADWTIWNAERPFMAIPSGTEFIDYRITANGPGAILIEQKPK